MTAIWRWRLARAAIVAGQTFILIVLSLWTWAGLIIGLMRRDENMIGMCGSLTALGFLAGLILAYHWAIRVETPHRWIGLEDRPTEGGVSVDVNGRLVPEGHPPARDRDR